MRNRNIKIVFTLGSLFITTVAFSQPGFPTPTTPVTGAPLDGGILIALLAGLGIGIKKVYGKNRNKD